MSSNSTSVDENRKPRPRARGQQDRPAEPEKKGKSKPNGNGIENGNAVKLSDDTSLLQVPGSSKSITESSLTPRSRSPVGLISYHQRYRNFIHKHEIPRKFLHVSIGFLSIGLYYFGVELSQVTPVLVALFAIIISLDLLRFRYELVSKYYIQFFGFLMRESEVSKINGIVWYLLGLIIVFSVFPKDIAVLSVLLLSWADTAASSIGRAYGYLTPKLVRNKSLAGSSAAFVTGVVASYILYGVMLPGTPELNLHDFLAYRPDQSKLSLEVVCLISGFVGSFSEAVDIWELDDNLTIPVISAVVMNFVFSLARK
ncbi:cytidylyltransferase family-domain-containing protein [Lipomyces oligophaga]|uniref:cytidylyltransferase family-domain-containing protein n=1 Tax=Lipomyces oligophaga TaxID=45792 RepID=UPI0034CD4901